MAILGASFQIGRSALAAYQSAIAVTGQNLANVGNPNYARQSPHLTALAGGMTLAGVAPGTGVSLSRLQRHVDNALEAHLRTALAQQSAATQVHSTLSQVESVYNELSDYDLTSRLNTLFASFTALQTDPLESTARAQVLADADAVVTTLQQYRSGLLTITGDLNARVADTTTQVNQLLKGIADLNAQIVAAQAQGNGGDGALRDRRDGLLRELATQLDIRTREQDSGIVNVYVGSEPLVEYGRARTLTTQSEVRDGIERVVVRLADTGAALPRSDGQLGALATARDDYVVEQLKQLDTLAQGLIYETNRLQSTGRGLVGYTSIAAAFQVRDITAALNSPEAGLTYPVQNGSFLVQVRDKASGQVTSRLIEVDLDGLNGDDTSLAALTTQLAAVPGLQASVGADGRLQLKAANGFEFNFAEDSSGALAALGVGAFFTGTDAATISVNTALKAEPRLIATALDGSVGDGSNAGLLAAVGDQVSTLFGAQSLLEFRERMVHDVAVQAAAAADGAEAADAIYSSLLAQRESLSGVSVDEEAINLTVYERAFQGASRYLSVVDSLANDVLSLVR